MKNERLCGLAMISIEYEVGQKLTEKELVDDFAKLKARKHLWIMIYCCMNYILIINMNYRLFL